MNIISIISKKHSDELSTQEIQLSFFRFIWQKKRNRRLVWIALVGIIIQFTIFKQLYPFPDFFSDSYSYIFAADAHLDVSIWPIGYSKFLLWFHYLTYSSTALTAFQYFFLELGAGYFFFTFLYLTNSKPISRILLFVFLFFNPLFLYIGNYVNSDPLFAALSLFWFTQLLWILHKPKMYQFFIQAILLFLCFTVRNNAYYYPIIAAIVFLLSSQNWKLKLIGILLPFMLIIPFVIHTRNVAYKMTGVRQYSLFTGWQLANNSLYMRGHIEVDSMDLPNNETRILNRIADRYFINRAPEWDYYLTAYVANFFIREPDAPLKLFFSTYFKPKNEYESIVAWGQASIIFGQYGSYLIKHNPAAFVQYYIWRNIKNYFIPPLEKLEVYNLGTKEVDPTAQYWFHFKNKSISAFSQKGQGRILNLYPLLFCFLNLYFAANLYWWFTNRALRKSKKIYASYIMLAADFWVVNLAFSVLSTINVFRYQVFPMIICFSFCLLLIEFSGCKIPKQQYISNNAG